IPNSDYGYGIVDAFAALKRVSTSIVIAEPVGTGGSANAGGAVVIAVPIATLRPTIRIRVTRVALSDIRLFLDNQELQILGFTQSTNGTWDLRVMVAGQEKIFKIVNVSETT